MVRGGERRGRRRVYDLSTAAADFAERDGLPDRTILICTQRRSGSTLLGEAFYFAGGLGCPLEYFNQGFQPSFERRWQSSDIRNYIADLHRLRTDPSGVFSIKLFWNDLAALATALTFRDIDSALGSGASQTADETYRDIFAAVEHCFPNPTFVFLTRRDMVRQAVSLAVASQTSVWRQLSRYRSSPRPIFDFDEIVQNLARIQGDNLHWEKFFRAVQLPHVNIVYEDISGDYDQTIRRLFDALGRPDAPIVRPRLERQANDISESLREEFLSEFRQRTRG